MRILPALVVSGLMIGVGCGGGSDEPAADPSTTTAKATPTTVTEQGFCGLVKEYEEIGKDVKRPQGEANQSVADNLRRALVLFDEIEEAAPPQIEAEIATLASVPLDAPPGPEVDDRAAAARKVDAYVAEECGTDFSLGRLDFTAE
ncbi:MAG: hypothetical protein H0U29_05030 [Acidimicrobiia bacterium]|nr:hypothetical protein [Acidimicrobiia bacterium]